MSSFDLNQASIEEDEYDLRVPNHLSTTLYHHSSDYNCIAFSDQHQQQEHKEILFVAGPSCDDHSLIAPDPANSCHGDDLELSLCDPFSSFEREKEVEELGIRERNWMPSKMRLMHKMMKYSTRMIVSKPSSSQDEIQPDRGFPLKNITRKKSNDNSDNSISLSDINRVCSDCNTTKTPLWRSGPCGPKSLCNACGIRQRKARRAMATALNGVGSGHATATMTNKIRKENKLGIDRSDLPFKKRRKMNIGTAPPPPKKIRFEDATVVLASDDHNSSSAVLQKVFPREERDAAILLMALSCGIIRS